MLRQVRTPLASPTHKGSRSDVKQESGFVIRSPRFGFASFIPGPRTLYIARVTLSIRQTAYASPAVGLLG